MNTIFDELVKTQILKFENDFINMSRQVFVNENGSLIHPGEFGMYRENIVMELIKMFLPSRLDVGTGFIITEQNKISTQCDIIIFDKNNTPVIESLEQRFFPIESVVGVIEVKSKLTKSQLKEALIKLSNIKKLREDVTHNLFIYKNHNCSKFNTTKNIRDQLATFLICESFNFDIESNIDTVFNDIYSDIDKSLFHNMILSLDKYCCLYSDEKKQAIYHSYLDYSVPSFRNMLIYPHALGYEKENILLFLQYFYMIISSVSVMYLEMTSYLGTPRPKSSKTETCKEPSNILT